jgi:tetratricopeptide (TPR) repeat protein
MPVKYLNFLILLALYLSACSLRNSLGSNTLGPAEQMDVEVRNSNRVMMDNNLQRSSEALHSFLVGQLQYNQEDFEKAIKNFESASKLTSKPAPILHVRLAELFVRSGQLEKALASATKAKEQNPDDVAVLLLYAGILESLGRSNEAEPIYEKLIAVKPDTIDSYIFLANLYIKRQEYDRGISVLDKLVKSHPNEPLVFTYLSKAYEMKGDLVEAERQVKKAISIEKDLTGVRVELLRILIKQKKMEEAKDLCELILKTDPNHLIARRVLGQLLLGESKFDEALKHLQVLEGIESDANDTRFKIALIEISKQNFREAITALSLVIAKNPDYQEARYYLATAYVAIGQKKEAIEELSNVSKQDKMFIQSRILAAFLLRQDKKFLEAEKVLREALDSNAEELGVASYLVLVLRDLGRFSEALKITEDLISKAPKNEKLLFQSATLLHDLNREPEAIQTMQKILELNPKNSDALNYIAYHLAEEAKDLDKAEIMIKSALEIKPNDGFYLDTLGWVYYRSGRNEEAAEVLLRAISTAGYDVVIVEHLVTVLLKLGNKEKAVEVIKSTLNGEIDDSDIETKSALDRIKKILKELEGDGKVN